MKKTIVDRKFKPGCARGRPGRAIALIAMAAIAVCTAVRLDAAVLDDFEHGVKFAAGGGETNYFVWGLTNGQLVIYTNTPIPTPHGDVLLTDILAINLGWI